MALQILQYEFLGPVPMSEWGPPMEEVVYVLLAVDGERFSVVYAGQCAKSEDPAFFTKNPKFRCWMQRAGSERNLHVAVLPMFGSSEAGRERVVGRILQKYRPPCNAEEVSCACCGKSMSVEREMEKSRLYRCPSCGVTDTRLK